MPASDRYIRQTLVPEIGEEGQKKLSDSKIMVIGCGGLGSIVAPYLAGAGIGQLILIDYDTISRSNLHRQVFYKDSDTSYKADALCKHISDLNPDISVRTNLTRVTAQNVLDIIRGADMIIDCTDDEDTKYVINDACMLLSKILVYGGMHQFDGYVALFNGDSTEKINLRDCFPKTPGRIANCSEIGVYNLTAGIIGLQQANTALKHILGIGADAMNKLQVIDVLYSRQTTIPIRKIKDYDFKSLLNESEVKNEHIDCNIMEINKLTYQSLSKTEMKSFAINIGNQPYATNISGLTIQEISMLLDPNLLNVFICPRGNTSLRLVKELQTVAGLKHYRLASLKGGLTAMLD